MQNRIKAVYEELIQINKDIYEKCQVVVKHYTSLKDKIVYGKEDWYASNIFTLKYIEALGITELELQRIICYRLHKATQSPNIEKFSILYCGGCFSLCSEGDVYNQWADFDVDLDKIIEKCKQIDIKIGLSWYEGFKKEQEKLEQEKIIEDEKREMQEYERLKAKYENKGTRDEKQI